MSGPGLFAIETSDGGAPRRVITNVRRLAGTERPPGSMLIVFATWLLALLDAGLLYVSFDAQYRYIFAVKNTAIPAMIEAAMLDAGMIILSALGFGLAMAGKASKAERFLIMICSAGSAEMNFAAADPASWRSVLAYTEFGRIANPVLFALDEVTQTAAVPLDQWLATSAGSGIQVCFIVHTPAQLRVRYGADAAKAIWALAGTKIVLGGNTDAEMAEEISRLAGTYGGEMALPVVPVAYIRQLPESRALVLAMNWSPIAVKVRPIWRRAAFRLRINPPAYQPLPQPVALPQIRPGAGSEAA